MTPEQFCYWLQGYTELGGNQPTEEQWKLIQEHLQLVFTKATSSNITPSNASFRPNRIC